MVPSGAAAIVLDTAGTIRRKVGSKTMIRYAENKEISHLPHPGDAPDKIARYKWRSTGKQGEACNISKLLLCVDDTYQRDNVEMRARELARDWWWMACGALIVVRRKDGQMVIIDGQHRWMAACRRSDIDTLPCVVFDEGDGGVAEEAAAFVKANSNRKTVRASDIFRAKAVAGDEWAVKASELIASIGRKASTASRGSGKTIACIGALQRCLRGDEAAMRRIWPLVAEICEGLCIPDALLQGLHFIETSLGGSTSLTGEPWVEKIRRVGSEALQRVAKNYATIAGRGGAKQWAAGIAAELNKGMRSNKLPDFRS